MIAFIGYLLLLLLHIANSVSNRRCYPLQDGSALCYIKPDPSVSLPWSRAMQWCKNIGATLPILEGHNEIFHNAFKYFGFYAENIWLGANSTCDRNNWYWTNGSLFTGTINNWNRLGDTHAYLVRNGTELKLVADYPLDEKSIICQRDKYSEASCASVMNSYWLNGKCYYICGNKSSWYSYWGNSGPTNIVSYDVVKELSRRNKDLTHIWIGLRCMWWTWYDLVTGRSYEVMDNLLASTYVGCGTRCITSFPTNKGTMVWSSEHCEYDAQFICQQHVNQTATTRPTTATSPKKSSDRWSMSTQKANFTSFTESNDIGIRLGVGFVGGLLLIVTIWLALITAFVYRKHRQSAGNKVAIPMTACKDYTLNDEPERAEMQKADESAYEAVRLQITEHFYQPIKAKTMTNAKTT